MTELIRITGPGGRIVVIDTDWGLQAIHGAEPALTATIATAWAGSAANGLAGCQLRALFADVGLPGPTVLAETITSTDPLRLSLSPLPTMAAAAHPGAVPNTEAHLRLDQLTDAGRRGHLVWALTMFVVAGNVPGHASQNVSLAPAASVPEVPVGA